MTHQTTFAHAEFTAKKKATRREQSINTSAASMSHNLPLEYNAWQIQDMFRDRADTESVFDELKNKWGSADFARRRLRRRNSRLGFC